MILNESHRNEADTNIIPLLFYSPFLDVFIENIYYMN